MKQFMRYKAQLTMFCAITNIIHIRSWHKKTGLGDDTHPILHAGPPETEDATVLISQTSLVSSARRHGRNATTVEVAAQGSRSWATPPDPQEMSAMTTLDAREQTPAHGDKTRPPAVRWLVIALVIALAAVGVLTVLLVLHSRDSTQASPSKPPDAVVALLDARIAAMNRGDGKAAGALYTPDGVMDEIEGMPYASDGKATYNTVGRAAIQERLQGLVDAGLRLEVIGEPIMYGDLVAEPTRFYQDGGSGYGKGMLVFQISPDNLIAHQWMIGWVNG